jgi:putative membrane protein
MKLLSLLGKAIVLAFWLVLLVNLAQPFAAPFALLLNLCGVLFLVAHLIEVLVFRARLQGRPKPWSDRLQIMLFGVFHLLALRPAKPAR